MLTCLHCFQISGGIGLAVHACLLLIALLGNVSVSVAICKRNNAAAHAHRHALLLSLAVSDLLTAMLCLPSAAISLLLPPSWTLPLPLCILIGVLQGTAHLVSNLTLSLVALDRFLALKKPKLAAHISSLSVPLIIFVWMFSLLFAVPRTLVTNPSLPNCRTLWHSVTAKRVYYALVVCLGHLAPCTAVVAFHVAVALALQRTPKDAMKMDKKPKQVGFMSRNIVIGRAAGKQKSSEYGILAEES